MTDDDIEAWLKGYKPKLGKRVKIRDGRWGVVWDRGYDNGKPGWLVILDNETTATYFPSKDVIPQRPQRIVHEQPKWEEPPLFP